ncbi:MAG TPA: murein biosynthesis integral membrane protein MurJ, partial [Thermoanaerobaculia bacterium]|nr:murein biosynthesis integral membrane protein MurJ [Thermoanaerobaculia bacterium]
ILRDVSDVNSAKPRGGFAVLVAAGIFLTRISGFVREKVFAHFLGNSDAAGIYRAAYRIPNILQNLFGEGVLSASFIPVYARLLAENDEETAGRVAGIVATLLALTISILVLIGVLLTPWLLVVIAPGYHGAVRDLTITVVRIMWPGIGILVLSAWCLGILNSHHKFFLSYVAPMFMNIVLIATLVFFGRRTDDHSLVVIAAWGVVAGALAQFGIQLPAVFRYAKHMRFAIETTLEPVREVIRNFTPVVIGKGVVQMSGYIDSLLATLLGTAAVSALAYAQIVSFLPISLFGMSVAAAELPQLSQMTGTHEEIAAGMRKRMERGLRQIAFFVVASAVAFITIGDAIVAALYQGGRFHRDDTLIVWYILIGSTLGLLAITLGRLYSNAFYALRDTKTPLRYAMIRVALTAALGWIFALPLRPLLIQLLELAHVPIPIVGGNTKAVGGIALTATAGIAGWLEFLLLRRGLARRIGAIRIPPSYLLRLWASALIAGVAGAAVNFYLRHHVPPIVNGAVVCGAFGVLYFAATIALGVPEARATLSRFTKK